MRSTRRLRLLVGAAVALGLLAAAGSSVAGGVRTTKPTEVVAIKPFGPLGLLHEYRVTANVRGTCLGGSLADQRRRDAWRCIAGNEILDPCFESPSLEHGFLACFEAPWSKRVVGLHLKRPLPAHGPTRGGFPWGIQLASGTRCTFETGASALVAGKRVNYGCVGGGALVGSIDRSSRAWTVLYQAEPGTGPLVRRAIAVAWY